MSFRDFSFPGVCDQLGLDLRQDMLFASVVPHPVRPSTRSRIEDGLLVSQGLNNEKARSEFVVAPLLLDLWSETGRRFGLFSGWVLDVDPAKGLTGVCDFLVARHPLVFRLRAPVLAIIEAKNDNVWNGFGQCVATMYAGAVFNTDSGLPSAPIYGCSTTGRDWKFFRLEGDTVTIDSVEYALPNEIDQIAGILLSVVGGRVATA